MKYLLVFLLFFFFKSSFAQNAAGVSFTNTGIAVNEISPIWPGCEHFSSEKERTNCFDKKLSDHISENFIVPYEIAENEAKRTISVSIEINKKGAIRIRKIKGGSDTIKEIVQNTFSSIPKLYPATIGGVKKKSILTIPITF